MKTHTTYLMSLFFVASIFFIVSPHYTTYSASGNESKDFYLVYTDNSFDGDGAMLFITSQYNTYGRVDIPGISFSETFLVKTDSVTTVSLPKEAEVQGSDLIDKLGVRVTANSPILVYMLNPGNPVFSNDAYVALPVEALSNEYLIMAWPGGAPSELAVVAPYDNTVLTITPTITTGSRVARIPYTVTLNQYQTYTLQGDDSLEDLTGTAISANSPIAVFGGNRCANIPTDYNYCDHLSEQLLPVVSWGRSAVSFPMSGRRDGDIIRILSSQDDTLITIKSAAEATISLNRSQFHEMVITNPIEIIATNPILVAQFATGSDYGGNPGDPLMMIIPPAEQFLNRYTFLTPTGYNINFVNIVVPTATANSIILDGAPIALSNFTKIESSEFSGAAISLAEGSHNISGSQPFGIYVYGFGGDVSYGYPGGIGSRAINPPPPNIKTPIILIPGFGGSTLSNNNGTVWMNIEKLCEEFRNSPVRRPNTDSLNVLELNEDGIGVPTGKENDTSYTTIQASSVMTRTKGKCDAGKIGNYNLGVHDLDVDVYGGLVLYLQSQGYQLGKDLFLFPYDWRRDLLVAVEDLDSLIDVHRNGGKVNIIAHSMGGLLSHNYILDPKHAAKVDTLITLGTPYLGTVHAYKGLYFGDDFNINKQVKEQAPGIFSKYIYLINEEKLRHLVKNWPGVYQLLPSKSFFNVYENGYIQEDREIDGNNTTNGSLNYDATQEALEKLFNKTLLSTAKELHTNQFDGYNWGTNGVKVYIITGAGKATHQRVRYWQDTVLKGLIHFDHTSIYYGNGDDTVPQRSADLHDDNTDLRGSAKTYYVNESHFQLPLNTYVQQQIMRLLQGDTKPVNENISTDPNTWKVNGRWVEVNSPVTLHLYDELGNHLGPVENGAIEYGIPGAQYDILGHDKSAVVSANIRYSLILTGTDSGQFDLRIRTVEDNNITQTVLFKDVPIVISETAKLSLDLADNYQLQIDKQGDGIFDTTISPTSVLNEQDSLDSKPPKTTIILDGNRDDKGNYVGMVKVVMIAKDNEGGTGIAKVEYTVDQGVTVQQYVAPYMVDATTVKTIYGKAVDRAGNEESELAQVQLHADVSSYSITVPLVLK